VFGHGQTLLQFHRRAELTSAGLVLPTETLAAVRRQVVEVARHKQQLLAAGQHLKRGLLLYGPPGVGKTHTVRHLTSSLTDTTVIQLTGNALHLVAEACSVARDLQPSMVVIEDVDLIAEDRGMHPGQHPLLFQLLNEMDGLAEDADVVFVLTTNRADLLEPALAPGQVASTRPSSSPCPTPRPAGSCSSSTAAISPSMSPAWTICSNAPAVSPPHSSRSCFAGRRCSALLRPAM